MVCWDFAFDLLLEGDVGELNVMIALKDYRRKGYAIKAVALMIMWGIFLLLLKASSSSQELQVGPLHGKNQGLQRGFL